MISKILNHVDFERANALLEGFNESTGFVTAILDLDGNILSQSGWRQICTDFHRKNSRSAVNCFVSDTELSNSINLQKKFHFYKCRNGLIDVSVPIVIRGEHIANLFSGQFFFEKPDISYFQKQAQEYEFDEKLYLEALEKVPIISIENVETAMDFLLNILQLIIEMTSEKMEQIEIGEAISKSKAALSESQTQLKENLRDLLETQRIAQLGTWRLNLATNQVVWSEELYKMYGFDPTVPPPPYTEHMKLFTPKSWEILSTSLEYARTTGLPYELELETVTKDGSNGWMCARGEAETDSEGNIISLWGAAQDITHYKKIEFELRQSEEKFQLLFNRAPLGYQSLDFDGCFIDVNQKWLDTLGYSKEEVIGKWFGDFLCPEYVEGYRQRFPVFKAQGYIHSEFEMMGKEGQRLFIAFDGKIGYDSDGEFKQTHCILQDITSQRQAEKALIESEERYRTLFENSGAGIGYYSTDGIVISFNQKAIENIGEKLEDYIGKSINDLFSKESAEMFSARIEKSILLDSPQKYEDFVILNPGAKWFSTIITNVKNIMGKIVGILVVSMDITERKQAEEKIAQQNRLFASLLRLLPVGVFMVDADGGKPLVVNEMGEALLGSGIIPDANEHNLSEIYKAYKGDTQKQYPTAEMPIVLGMKGISSHIDDMVVERPDGSRLLLEVYGTPVKDEQGKPWASLVTYMDITKRRKTEDELYRVMAQNQWILDHLQDAYFQADLSGNCIMVNPQAVNMFGYSSTSELIGQPIAVIYSNPDNRLRVLEELKRDGSITDLVTECKRKDGSKFWVSMNAQFIRDEQDRIIGTEGLIRDISERITMIDEIELQRDDLIASNAKLANMLDQSVRSISKIGELRDAYTAGHQRRVQDLSCALAYQLGLSDTAIMNLSYGALIHDIGKIYIPSEILNKPGKISNLEFQILQTHVEHGYNVVKEIEFSDVIPEMVYQHHERLDGSGYPQGLSGDQIIIESRILAVSDVVEAMTSHRPYRPALGIDAALEEISSNRGEKYDSEVVDACIRLFREKDFSFSDAMSDSTNP